MSNFNKRSLVAAWLGIASLSLVGCAKSPELKTASGKPVEFWVEALKAPNTDAKQRLKAVKTLSNVGPAHPQAIPALIEALEQPDATLRGEVVLALFKIGPAAKGALPALERLSQSDKDEKVRDYAKKMIAVINGSSN